MEYAAKAMRSVWRPANLAGQPGTQLRTWYRITNAATAGLPTQVSIYDEIGYFGVAAGEFMADLKAINGDIELHINSPGGDVHDGIAIYNQLKQRSGSIAVVVDGLAASAASFIAQAASPGKLQMAPHANMMIHNGFSMSIGDANDLRKTADLLDMITTEIAGIYAERSGKPVDYWLGKMADETWFTDVQAVAEGLADSILGQEAAPAASWDLSVFGNAPATPVVNADGSHPDAGPEPGAAQDKTAAGIRNADGDGTSAGGKPVETTDLGDGWVQDPDGQIRFDPDGDGDDDSQASTDTDHDYWDEDGNQIKEIPPKPNVTVKDAPPMPSTAAASLAEMFPVLNADVDSTPWDASKAWAAGAASDNPEAFYRGICAGRKAGDPSTQDAWALPYKYGPSSPPNAAGVKAALGRLPQTQGLTNADEAKSTLQKAMKQVNPDYDPDASADALEDAAIIAELLAIPAADVDDGAWNPKAALALAASSGDPAKFYAGICAGRRAGDPVTPQAWALPYRYSPASAPNAAGVRQALAELPSHDDLANPGEARTVLDKAMKVISPAYEPDEEIDAGLLSAAFALGLEGAGK